MTVWFDRISYEYPACKFKLGNDSWITNDWNALIEMRIEIFIFFPLFISPTFGIGRVNSETSSSSKKFSERAQRLRDKIGWRDRKGEGEKNAKSSIDKRASTNISTRQRVFRCNYPPPTPINSYIISQLNYTIRIHSISPCRDLQDLRGRKMIPSLDPMTGLREEEFPSRATCTTTTRTTTRGQWRKKIRGETRLRSWSVEGGYVETIEAIKVDK